MLKYVPFILLLVTSCKTAEVATKTTLEALPLDMRVEQIKAADSDALFGTSPEFEVLFGGMNWSEGPLVLPNGQIICSDVPENHILGWSGKGSKVYLENSGDSPKDYSSEPGSNGLALDAEGRLILCQHGSRRVVRMDAPIDAPKAKYITLADNYLGKKFNSPNDLVVAADGSILFTDPIYGLPGRENSDLKELDYCGVFRIRPDGSVQLLSKEYLRPNGIGLSPDGKTLYVADSDRSRFVVDAIPILDTDYSLGPARHLIDAAHLVSSEIGSTDGLSVAKNGRIFATAPGGVWVMESNGDLIAKVRTGTRVSNVELSPREDYLYMTADYYLIRIKLN